MVSIVSYNQEKALVGAFSVIVQTVVEPIDRFTALIITLSCSPQPRLAGPEGGGHGVRPALALGLHTDPGPTLVTSDGAGSGRDLTSLYLQSRVFGGKPFMSMLQINGK